MVSSLGYLVLLFPLANALAQSSHIPLSSNPSVTGNRPFVLTPPFVSSDPTASNASIFECYSQLPVEQKQRKPIDMSDCNVLIMSMLIQADSKNEQPNATDASGSATKSWTFGTCFVTLRIEDGGAKSYTTIGFIRWIATIVTSCSDQRPVFLGGTLSTSQSNFRVEVSYPQVDPPDPVALLHPAISTTLITCWDWNSPGRPHLQPFRQSACDETIVRMLASEDLQVLRRSSAARPFYTRGFGGCILGLYPRENLQEVYKLVKVLQVAAQVLRQCHSDDIRGELGGYGPLGEQSIIDVVIYGKGSDIPMQLLYGHPIKPAVPARFLKRVLPAKVATPNTTDELSFPDVAVECWRLHDPASHPYVLHPFSEQDCMFLVGRLFRSPDALVIRAWTAGEVVARAFRTCGISMRGIPGAGRAIERFSMGDIAHIAELIIARCHVLGPPYLGGVRVVTPGSAFAVSVIGSGHLPEAAVPLQFSDGNASLAKHIPAAKRIPSGMFKRALPTEASPSPTVPLAAPPRVVCFAVDPARAARRRPFSEADCTALIQFLLHNPDAMIPEEVTTERPPRHWSVGTCRITFAPKPNAREFRREYISLYEILHVASSILEACRRFGPPHFGGLRDMRRGSAFRVTVWASHTNEEQIWDEHGNNSTEPPIASSDSTWGNSTRLHEVA